MTSMVNIENSDLVTFIKRTVIETLQDLLSQQSPKRQIALLLHSHLRDLGEFRCELRNQFNDIDNRFDKIDEHFKKIDNRFNEVDGRFNKIEIRLDRIENTMVTKDDLNTQITRVIDSVRRLLDSSDRTAN